MARFLVVLDVDSTLIEDEVIELLAAEAGSAERVAEITFRAMNGEMDFEESLRERVATLEGLPSSVFETVGSRVTVTRGVPDDDPRRSGCRRAGRRGIGRLPRGDRSDRAGARVSTTGAPTGWRSSTGS